MKFKLMIWRQQDPKSKGKFVTYEITNISPDMSFLEMLDVLNEELTKNGEDTIAFSHDCREGICGSCGIYINGRAHGPSKATTTCQLYMRNFTDNETIVCEPWRAKGFPVIKDLVVDKSAFDRILRCGGYVSVNTGSAPDANLIPISKKTADEAFDAAACIGCGACVAACKNASAMLFVSAKVSHLALLPQGYPEKHERVMNMISAMDKEGFGNCTNTGACEAECPKQISLSHIARLNRNFISVVVTSKDK
ncbi:MAG: succinate dehydrogenase/fumarate reductase iron-sulfur subunit [Planctomycetes bacterium]|nr:succinate dehydrogenase/fumarate reductase iron-sulfur subunit [Planctomycetota bacterium]